MATSLLWLPDNASQGHPTPAFIFVHGWGGYPHDNSAKELGPALANEGYAFLSVCLRRRGMEGQLSAVPDNDLRDLQVAVDYLHTQGCQDIFLIGEEIGGLSALRYQAKHKDMRVKGVALLNPADDPTAMLQKQLGDDAYNSALRKAGVAIRQGAGMDFRIDLFPDKAPPVTQQAAAFIAWWSPTADTQWARMVADSASPLLLISSTENPLPESLTQNISEHRLSDTISSAIPQLPKKLKNWSVNLGARNLIPADIELVDIESDGQPLYGFYWHTKNTHPKIAMLLMHGLTSSPTSPLFGKMAPILAQQGIGVLAIETHRSGWAGHESALLEQDTADIDNWIQFLLDRGVEQIILAGTSMGSLSIGRYQAVMQSSAVVALAHLMPTADGPQWFRKAAGEAAYQEAVDAARQAIEEGNGNTFLVDVDVRQPPPSLSQGRFRWTQRAASWLSWWGPEADSCNTQHIAEARVPILLLSGTADSYNDPARFAELKAAAVNAPSVDQIWYEDIDHGLAGVERLVADDLHNWLCKIGILNAG